jgi:hypothetical protein
MKRDMLSLTGHLNILMNVSHLARWVKPGTRNNVTKTLPNQDVQMHLRTNESGKSVDLGHIGSIAKK